MEVIILKKLNSKGFAISTVIYGTFILFIMILAILLATMTSSLKLLRDNVNNINDYEITEKKLFVEEPYIDDTGLVPIKYKNGNWIVTSKNDSEWYNYENQMWANAALLYGEIIKKEGDILNVENDVQAMFVWIPRFSYTIGCANGENCLGYKTDGASDLSLNTPGAIDIKFIKREQIDTLDLVNDFPTYIYIEKDRRATNWYTHPAFWWDDNNDGERDPYGSEELSGIWVGKYETEKEPIRIIPGISTMESIDKGELKKVFELARTLETDGLITNVDSHMMKNSEWAAVVYLSQSKYGKYGNKNYSGANKRIVKNPTLITGGGGEGSSTTGNIYGIYDMRGRHSETVMGNYNNNYDNQNMSNSENNFLNNVENKYYDLFTMEEPGNVKSLETVGQAAYEVNGWYGEKVRTFFCNSFRCTPWVSRDQHNAGGEEGIFSIETVGPSNVFAFRITLVKKQMA